MPKSAVFLALSDLLTPYADEMVVKADSETNYYLEESKSTAKPQMFGAVQVKKNYTSFHLFPVYTHPELLEGLSPELRKRMQGKSCFNFKTEDQILIGELKDLVEKSYATLE